MQMAGAFGMGMEVPGMYGMGAEVPAVFAMGMEGIPLVDIDDPSDVDVLCGRGGASLKHPGNLTYRRLVHMNKGYYISCLKTEKLRISQSIVAAIREQRGRFLERDGNKGTWYDIGDKKAIEKTSQALREGQPKLRQQIVEMGVGQPCMGMEYKMTPGFMPVPMVTPALTLSPAAIQQQIAQQQLAQQRLLAQQRIIQQQMVQQQYAQQQVVRDQMVRQQLLAQQQGVQASVMTTSIPPGEHAHTVTVNTSDGMMEQQINVKEDPGGVSHDQFGGESQQRPSPSVSNDDPMDNGQLTTTPNFMAPTSGNHARQFHEGITQENVGLMSPLREFEGSYSSLPPLEMHASLRSVTAMKEERELLSPLPAADIEDSSRATEPFNVNLNRAERPPLHQSDVQQQPLSHHTDTNSSAMRILDRRRIFAKMKYSRPPSFGKNINRSSASLGMEDGMPDIHMVGSTFSLLSNISSNQDMKLDDMNISSRSVQKLRDDHMVLGSRRSLMSGLSKISDSSDVHSMFSDLSRKFANISTQSIPTSEISGVEEGDQEDLDESLHVDPVAMARAVHRPFHS